MKLMTVTDNQYDGRKLYRVLESEIEVIQKFLDISINDCDTIGMILSNMDIIIDFSDFENIEDF